MGISDTMLDRALDAVPTVPVPAHLEARILADFDRQAGRNPGAWLRRRLDSIWPGVPLWQPAAALALSLVIGLGLGVFGPFDFVGHDESAGALSLDAPSFLLMRDG